MGPTVTWRGLTELQQAFRDVHDDLPKALKEANKTAAQVVLDATLPRVPVLTGRLKGTVRATATNLAGRVRAGSADVPYAMAIHWGVGPRAGKRGPHNIQRRPFLYDAMKASETVVATVYADRINQLIRHAVKR